MQKLVALQHGWLYTSGPRVWESLTLEVGTTMVDVSKARVGIAHDYFRRDVFEPFIHLRGEHRAMIALRSMGARIRGPSLSCSRQSAACIRNRSVIWEKDLMTDIHQQATDEGILCTDGCAIPTEHP